MNWQLTKTIIQLVVMVGLTLFVGFGSYIKVGKQNQYVENCIKAGGSPIKNYPDDDLFQSSRRCVKAESLVDIPN